MKPFFWIRIQLLTFVFCAVKAENADHHLSKVVHHLQRDIQIIQTQQIEDRRMFSRLIHKCRSHTNSQQRQSTDGIRETLAVLKMESRALSHVDSQVRSIQSSLSYLVKNSEQESTAIRSFRSDLLFFK